MKWSRWDSRVAHFKQTTIQIFDGTKLPFLTLSTSLSIKSRQCSCSFLFHWSLCSFRRYRRRRTHTTRRRQLPPRRRRASRVSEASVALAMLDNWDTGIHPNLILRQRHKCKPVASFRACKDTPTASSPDINRRNIWGKLFTRDKFFSSSSFARGSLE